MTRLDEKCKAVQVLRKKFRSKEIRKDEDPKNILKTNVCFYKHSVNAFWTRVNKLREEYHGNDG